ncbi:MAG: hypothetical protein JW925_06375 [Syntrophaceae bacterium]|nr:hypothetical protein [Syntrophaceae bacterium]
MKATTLIIFLSLTLIFLFAGCQKDSSDWVKYKADSDGNIYLYDKTKIKEDAANHTVEVWAKQIYSDQGRIIEVQSRIKEGLSIEGYDKLAHKICRYEINCEKKGVTILSISHFDRDGKSLYFGVDKGEKKMFDINPDSTSGALFKAVCSR